MKKVLVLLFVVALLAAGISEASAARTTRDLVFDDAEESATPKTPEVTGGQVLAVKTTIVLTRDGSTSTVLPNHVFKSGDSIKMVFTPNVDGYVYWLTKGSSGKHSVLFPTAKAGMDNAVKRNQEYSVPTKGAFRFDDKAGSEELLCILSTEKLPDLEKVVTETASGKFDEAGGQIVASLEEKNTAQRKTRDLVFDDEDAGDVNTKKQEAAKGTPFVAHYVLTHN